MNISDEELLSALKIMCNVFPKLFSRDVALGITDKEKFIAAHQAETFKLSIEEGSQLRKGDMTEKAVNSREKQSENYPKEVFGFPIASHCIPVINPSTNNVVGTINFAVSMEKQSTVTEMVNELQEFSQGLVSSSEELESTTQELSSTRGRMDVLVNETQEGIKYMDDIIKYIKSVADTTNLLGLNAAIEASRAGEQGKGFNVIAEEIRKLAANSKNSTTQINEALVKMKENINNILEVFNELSSTGETQAAQAEHLSSGGEKLNKLVDQLLKFSKDEK